MVSEAKRMTVGFLPPSTKDWMGGVNYYCNLFYALPKCSDVVFNPYVFLGKQASTEVIALYKQHQVNIVQSSALDGRSLKGMIDRFCFKLTGKRFFLNLLLKKHSVALISHVQSDMGVDSHQIGWIPDFQHIHLPDMFSAKEIAHRNSSYQSIARKGKAVILSSYDALNDFKNFAVESADKGCVAQFVSQPPPVYFDLSDDDVAETLKKYAIDRQFIYVPNQFWRHKNHQLLLEAVNLSVKQGANPLILCSGLMDDYRDTAYIERLKAYVSTNNLSNNVKFLGLIPYKDVFLLIKSSQVVLNPSRFEGWSSAVEECKSVGKMMLLSDIAVHKEQYPEAMFFGVESAESLATQIIALTESKQIPDLIATQTLEQRTQLYAKTYSDICQKAMNAN